MRDSVVPRVFLHLPEVHYLSETERQPPWFSLLEAPFTNLFTKFGQQYCLNGTEI